MAANSKPWQNRPSLIACWEHTLHAEDTSGLFVESMITQMDSSLTGNSYVCVPRACRLTRICFRYVYSAAQGVTPFDYYFQKSIDCGANFSDTIIQIPLGSGGFSSNCYCADINVSMDECNVWKSFVNLASPTSFPFFRIIHHYELR